MFKKPRTAISFFILATGVVLLTHCQPDKRTKGAYYSESSYHGFLQTDSFKQLPRIMQIQKCAECHKQEYDNEMAGPHANAYKNLVAHKEFVNSDKYNCWFYTRRVNLNYENCAGCHAPQNMFQERLLNSNKYTNEFVANLLKLPFAGTKSRDNNAGRLTGIDCFSCHYDGDRMISLLYTPKKGDSLPENQNLATITKNNLNCYPCHMESFQTLNAALAIKKTGNTQCLSCHQEYNSSGKGTHYLFWEHDNPEVKQNPLVVSVMDEFRPEVILDKSTVRITWRNTAYPHKLSFCPERIVQCDILDKDSVILGTKKIRVNDKEQFDKITYEEHQKNLLYGEIGDTVLTNGEAHVYDLQLKNVTKASMMRIKYYNKAQYWFPDSLGTLMATKTYSIPNAFTR